MPSTYEAASATYEEIRKAQWVRWLDVYVLGPMTIAVSFWPGALPRLIRWAMATYGLATVLYNRRNMIATRERLELEAHADDLLDQLLVEQERLHEAYYQPAPAHAYGWQL